MARISIPEHHAAPADAKPFLDATHKALGFTPNSHRLMALSPPVLAGFIALQGQLNKTLDAATRHSIAHAVSQVNGCSYCLSAHAYLATQFGKASSEEVIRNRHAQSENPKREAAVRFAQQVVEQRGKVTDADLAAVRAAGWTEAQIVEIVALSAQFLLTNLMNNVAQTEIDFPAAVTA